MDACASRPALARPCAFNSVRCATLRLACPRAVSCTTQFQTLNSRFLGKLAISRNNFRVVSKKKRISMGCGPFSFRPVHRHSVHLLLLVFCLSVALNLLTGSVQMADALFTLATASVMPIYSAMLFAPERPLVQDFTFLQFVTIPIPLTSTINSSSRLEL